MKRVLVTGGSQIGKAGVASIVYKWGTSFSDKVVYDYLMQRGLPDQIYIDSIEQAGSKIYTMNDSSPSMICSINWVRDIVKEFGYETIHINTDSAYVAAAYIYASKKGGIKNIYVHSHCTRIDDNNAFIRLIKTTIHYLCRPYVKRNTKAFLSCSTPACRWMFGRSAVQSDKFVLIKNGVEVEKYLYSEDVRKQKRAELGISDQYVIGSIGRFSYQKNHSMLIDIFKKYNAINPKTILLLVGEGELETTIKQKVKSFGLENRVMFVGRRRDVNELLSAMDILIMPSRFEGLPVTAVEAQMASLPCILSDRITKETKFTPNVRFASINDVNQWIPMIEALRDANRPYPDELLKESMFNIINASRNLENELAQD